MDELKAISEETKENIQKLKKIQNELLFRKYSIMRSTFANPLLAMEFDEEIGLIELRARAINCMIALCNSGYDLIQGLNKKSVAFSNLKKPTKLTKISDSIMKE